MRLQSTLDAEPAALHAAFSQAFADYVAGPFELPLAQWPGFLARQGVDLSLGRVALDEAGAVQAFALVAPRPALARWRLATMGAVPAARGSGAALALLEDFIARGQAAGLDALELEAFAQNERALRLYRRKGFVERHALHGYQLRAADDASAAEAGRLVAQADALDWLESAESELADLPLQVSAAVIRALPVPWTAWRRGTAQLIFNGDDRQGLLLRSLVDLDPAQRDAEALLRALLASYPGATIGVPALQRADLGGEALRRCGFTPQPLHQWLMRLDLR